MKHIDIRPGVWCMDGAYKLFDMIIANETINVLLAISSKFLCFLRFPKVAWEERCFSLLSTL